MRESESLRSSPLRMLPTNVPGFDAMLGGGLPVYSLNIVAGRLGTGKTILTQQIVFNHARSSANAQSVYFTTLSEPRLKMLRFAQQYGFFDAELFGERVIYHDLGREMRRMSLSESLEAIIRVVGERAADLIAIDSFRAFRDLAGSVGEYRGFCHDLSERLASARCTAILTADYGPEDSTTEPELATADGIFRLAVTDRATTLPKRSLQIRKLRGQAADLRPHLLQISDDGIRIAGPDGGRTTGTRMRAEDRPHPNTADTDNRRRHRRRATVSGS